MCRAVILLCAAALSVAVPGRAQFKLRDLTGIVPDNRGNRLPGAVVQLENTANLVVRSYTAGKDGRYYFHELSDNFDFTLRAGYRSRWSKRKTLSKFDSSSHSELNLVIPIE